MCRLSITLIGSVAVFFLSVAKAQACPELSGRYSCESEGSRSSLIIGQTVKNGVTTYVIDGDDMIVDGQPHVNQKQDSTVTYQASCNENSVLYELKVEQGPQRLDLKGSIQKRETPFIRIVSAGLLIEGQKSEPFSILMNCQKVLP